MRHGYLWLATKLLGFFHDLSDLSDQVTESHLLLAMTNALAASTFIALRTAVSSIADMIGILLYIGSLSFEVAADRQKSAWVEEKARRGAS